MVDKKENPYRKIEKFVRELIAGGIQKKAPTKNKKALANARVKGKV
jgi:hypothetical protein